VSSSDPGEESEAARDRDHHDDKIKTLRRLNEEEASFVAIQRRLKEKYGIDT